MAEYRERVAFLASAMVKLLLLFLAFAMVVIEPVFSSEVLFDGRKVEFVEAKINWYEANDYCLQNGMRLMTPNSRALQKDYRGFLSNTQIDRVWMGASIQGRDEYTWTTTGLMVSKTPTDYKPGEPNNFKNKESCLVMEVWKDTHPYGWNDLSCLGKFNFFCEEKPKKRPIN